MMRQQSMRRKLLYLLNQPLVSKWAWRIVVRSISLYVTEGGINHSMMGFLPSHHPEPPGVEHAI